MSLTRLEDLHDYFNEVSLELTPLVNTPHRGGACHGNVSASLSYIELCERSGVPTRLETKQKGCPTAKTAVASLLIGAPLLAVWSWVRWHAHCRWNAALYVRIILGHRSRREGERRQP